MDWLTFISNIVRDLAWPVLLLFLVKLVLGKLPQVSKFVKSIKYRDIEVNLREIFEEVREEIEEIRENTPPTEIPDLDLGEKATIDKIEQLAQVDPAIAMMEVYRSLEAEIVKIIQHEGHMRWVSPQSFVRHMLKEGEITAKESHLFNQLRKIRNAAVHSDSELIISVAEVKEYEEFVGTFVKRLHSIKDPLKNFRIPQPNDH